MVTDIPALPGSAPAIAALDTASATEAPVPAWAGPGLLLALLMLAADLVALIPLGQWMAEYGIVPVCAIYLLHVLAATALAVWTVIRIPTLHLDR
ncbi:hypothetical protein [Nocardia sp. AG03]|uniref:hypothetical protein n=1 Tax=Nocardia sp. AG03 TaxID=3025312 RepID=UPI002418976D|nr:hypothetical protein [Nocardia sp. AG03]